MSETIRITQVREIVTLASSEQVVIENDNVSIVSIGIQGPVGPPGATGPQGPAGGTGEEEVPTFPIVDPKSSSNLAAGASVNLDSVVVANTKTGKVQQITLSSSAPCKWEIKKSSGGVDTTLDIILTSGNSGNMPSHEWEPPHKDYATLAGNGSNTFFRVAVTNLDARNQASVYVTFFFDEV